MNKTEARWLFLQCQAKLIAYAAEKKIKLICVDFDRSEAEQAAFVARGASKAKRSQHQDWLAMDFAVIDANGNIDWSHERGDEYEILGTYWETIHQFCRWGGNFGRTPTKTGWDAGHFEISKDALAK